MLFRDKCADTDPLDMMFHREKVLCLRHKFHPFQFRKSNGFPVIQRMIFPNINTDPAERQLVKFQFFMPHDMLKTWHLCFRKIHDPKFRNPRRHIVRDLLHGSFPVFVFQLFSAVLIQLHHKLCE